MTERLARIGDDAVVSATGHGWDHWLDVPDDRDAVDGSHEETVDQLEDAGVESAWWRQTIANAYEVDRGLREVGETTDAGFQISVQRTVPIEQGALWELLLSSEGRVLWLGDGTTLRVRHEKLASQDERERMRAHWRGVPDAVQAHVSEESARAEADAGPPD